MVFRFSWLKVQLDTVGAVVEYLCVLIVCPFFLEPHKLAHNFTQTVVVYCGVMTNDSIGVLLSDL